MYPCGKAVQSRTHIVGECEIYKRGTGPSSRGALLDRRCGWSYGSITECLTRKKTEVEVLPVVDVFQESAFSYHFYCGRFNTGE